MNQPDPLLLIEQLGLILDVADTVHDMVHPVTGNSHRCIIEGKHDGIYNRELFINALKSSTKYAWLSSNDYTKFPAIDVGLRKTLCNLVAMLESNNTPYQKVSKFLDDCVKKVIISSDGKRARDYEDAVMYYVNKLLDNAGRFDNYQDVNVLFDEKFNSTEFMIDYLPCGVPPFQHQNKHMHSIATLWDPSQKMGLRKNNYIPIPEDKLLKPVGTQHVSFVGDNVVLTDKTKKCTIPKSILQSRAHIVLSNQPYFRNSVGALCDFVNKCKKHNVFNDTVFNSDEVSFQDIVFETLFSKQTQSTDSQQVGQKRPMPFDLNVLALENYIKNNLFFQEYVEFLSSKNLNELIFKVCDMKRSGDYGQITMVRELNKDKLIYLLTGDRLCYLRCKLEGVPAVLLKPKSNTCMIYPFTTATADLNKTKQELTDQLNKINIPNSLTLHINIIIPTFTIHPSLKSMLQIHFDNIQLKSGTYEVTVTDTELIKNNLETNILTMSSARQKNGIQNQIKILDSLTNNNNKIDLTYVPSNNVVLNKQSSQSNKNIENLGTITTFKILKGNVPLFLHPLCDAFNSMFDFCSADIKPNLHYPSETYQHVLSNQDLFTEMVFRSMSTKRRRTYVPKELLNPLKDQLQTIYQDIEEAINDLESQYGTFTFEENKTPKPTFEVYTPFQSGGTISMRQPGSMHQPDRSINQNKFNKPPSQQVRYNNSPRKVESRNNLDLQEVESFKISTRQVGSLNKPARRKAWGLDQIIKQQPMLHNNVPIDDVVDQLFYLYDMADFVTRLYLSDVDGASASASAVPARKRQLSRENMILNFFVTGGLTAKTKTRYKKLSLGGFTTKQNIEILFDAVRAFPGHIQLQLDDDEELVLYDIYDVVELCLQHNTSGGGFIPRDGTPVFRSRLQYRFIHRSHIGTDPFLVYNALMNAYAPNIKKTTSGLRRRNGLRT